MYVCMHVCMMFVYVYVRYVLIYYMHTDILTYIHSNGDVVGATLLGQVDGRVVVVGTTGRPPILINNDE